MTTYYRVTAILDGDTESLYSSYVKADCVYELDCERATWKEEGYKGFKITSEEVTDLPDAEVYEDEVVTKKQLWVSQAPLFNFELNEDELLTEALERGYVIRTTDSTLYLINPHYPLSNT